MKFLKLILARLMAVSRRTWAFFGGGLIVFVLMVAGILYGWDYTNSPPFCGTTCHTMPPEYIAYQVSPHARVACVECHIGRTFVGNAFTRKAGDLMHVVRYSSNQYTFPLYANEMQPARESCEKCHWPEKFANDKVITIKHYSDDAANSLSTTYLIMKTGGGTEREGRGFGIHWHIENEVNFISLDPLKQSIPWIEVVDAQGNHTVYSDAENPLTPDQIAKADKHRMDCIDCHNRISHTFQSPTQAMDQALSLNRIDATIPLIHKKGVDVLSGSYKSAAEADQAIDTLNASYQKDYASYYQQNSTKVKDAIASLKTIYRDLVFPTQDLSWTTHPDNLGHKDWAGCFRCHDGKHFSQDNKQAIPLECNLCHTLPDVSKIGGPAPVISIAAPDEPESHRSTTWLAEHRTQFNTSCQQCHDTRNAGGSDNSSFCSNSACHGNKWTFAGLNAPSLAKLFPTNGMPPARPNVVAPQIPHPIAGDPDCQICHGPKSLARPYPSDHVGRTNQSCLACHQPTIPPTQTAGIKSAPPAIPHNLAGRTQCLGCHASGAGSIPQIPQFHKDYEFQNTACLNCHKSGEGIPAPASPAPTATPTRAAIPTVQPTAVSAPTQSAPVAQPTAAPATVQPTAAPASPQAPASAPRLQPANHAGRTVCLVCHSSGVGGAPIPPADHEGRTDAVCAACHKPR